MLERALHQLSSGFLLSCAYFPIAAERSRRSFSIRYSAFAIRGLWLHSQRQLYGASADAKLSLSGGMSR